MILQPLPAIMSGIMVTQECRRSFRMSFNYRISRQLISALIDSDEEVEAVDRPAAAAVEAQRQEVKEP